MKKIIISTLFASLSIAASSAFAEKKLDLESEVTKCALLGEDSKRHQCYDALGTKLIGKQNTESKESATSAAKKTTPNELPDTLGGRKFDDNEKAVETNRGKVVACKKSYDSRWFFIFENGQVWKQTDRRQRFFDKDCTFFAVLSEDGFGYKMNIEGKKSKIRVKRTR